MPAEEIRSGETWSGRDPRRAILSFVLSEKDTTPSMHQTSYYLRLLPSA